jgi:hypothetical protein
MPTRDSREEKDPQEPAPEDQPGEVGAEGGSKTARRAKLPPQPDREDDSAVGDTDQHSSG